MIIKYQKKIKNADQNTFKSGIMRKTKPQFILLMGQKKPIVKENKENVSKGS